MKLIFDQLQPSQKCSYLSYMFISIKHGVLANVGSMFLFNLNETRVVCLLFYQVKSVLTALMIILMNNNENIIKYSKLKMA